MNAIASTQVYLVDDNDGFRESTAWLLETAGFEPLAFASGAAFLAAYDGQRHGTADECLVSDIRMPQMSGLQLQEELIRRGIRLPLVFVTAHGDVPLAVEAMKAGVADFIEKPFDDEALLSAIHSALQAGEKDRQGAAEAAEIAARIATLSGREHEVLQGLVAGRANKVIAYDLGISPRTIEIYRANVMTKMKASSLSELVRMAMRAERV